MERYNDMNTPMIALAGVVGAIIVFAAIVGLQVLYYTTVEQQTIDKVVDVPDAASDSALAAQEIKLAQYGWIGPDHKKAAIPIDRAMELVVAELQESADKE